MKPRILFLCTACPFGEISGAGLRTRNIARILDRMGDMTMVVATGQEWTESQIQRTKDSFNLRHMIRYQDDHIRHISDRFRKVFDPRFMNTNGVSVSGSEKQLVEDLVAEHDVVWIHTLKLANAFRRFHWPKSVTDVDDFPSRFHASAVKHAPAFKMKLLRCQRAFSWKRSERLCLERFSILAVCKENDRDAFGDPSRVHAIPNGFEIPDAIPADVVRMNSRLGMIGDFHYLPNHDGLRWFITEVWPAIRGRVPDAGLHLIGKGSAEVAKEFADQGVSGLGYVPDPATEMARWTGMIVPTRLGGGTHLKVAEALARGIPLVCTRHGSRGYDLVSGENAMIADTPVEFSEACIRLIEDGMLRDRLAIGGLELFKSRYSWDAIAPAVERAVEHCQSFGSHKSH